VNRTRLSAAGVLVAGMLAAAVTAGALAMSASDAAELVAIAAGTVVAVVVLAVPALRALRNRSVAVQVSVLALAVVGGTALGVFAAARAMFISQHDLGAIEVVLLAAAGAGIAGAILLGGRVAATSTSLVAVTRRIGTAAPADAGSAVSGPPELARLAQELRDMEARLEESRRRERAVEQSRRELVAWVSHDLRTPLAALRAMVEAIEDGVVSDPETVARYHVAMRDETDRLAGLVDDLFELSRTQAGALQLELERVSLGDLVSDAIAGVAPVAAARNVRLEGRLHGPAPDVCVSAPELLRALRNVLENAIRHTPSDGAVVVEAGARPPDRAFVSVHDTGGGVPERDLGRIFEAGFQADESRTSGAAGLGLAIARGFVEAHRGAITVENDGPGARFTVELPRAPVA
jgi:signal transduction histidine kinase